MTQPTDPDVFASLDAVGARWRTRALQAEARSARSRDEAAHWFNSRADAERRAREAVAERDAARARADKATELLRDVADLETDPKLRRSNGGYRSQVAARARAFLADIETETETP